MRNLTELCNRDLMSLRNKTIRDMNDRDGWIDRTKLDAIQAEIKERIETGRML